MQKRTTSKWPEIGYIVLKVVVTVVCLYFFICSIGFLGTASRLLSGKQSGKLFSAGTLLQNPILGVMLGSLFTAMIHSSSTTTSVVVGMVGADVLDVKSAIPMIMGANIGTSFTSTLVSLTQIQDQSKFKRAFSTGVIHDMFNWLTVITLLSVEVTTHFLFHITNAMVSGLDTDSASRQKPPDLLKAITKPFTNSIVQIDKKVLEGWSLNDTRYENVTTLLKFNCKRPLLLLDNATLLPSSPNSATGGNESVVYEKYQCGYFMANWNIDDLWLGLVLLFISLAMLIVCLYLLMKILNSLMENHMAGVIKKTMNASIPGAPWLTGYIAMLVGLGITLLIQSSNVFTVTLTPLAGAGLLELHRAYPLTLGSNLGTTTTGLMAALAVDGDRLRDSLQIALCHTVFNICGILLFYPIPFMRWPLPMATLLGETVAKYRWFAIFYLVAMFLVLPMYIFGLSLLGPVAIYIGFVPVLVLFIFVIVINVVQNKRIKWLPSGLRNWSFLPEYLRSLEPYDRIISKIPFCPKGGDSEAEDKDENAEKEENKNDNMEMA